MVLAHRSNLRYFSRDHQVRRRWFCVGLAEEMR
jgi:hypothetical protein